MTIFIIKRSSVYSTRTKTITEKPNIKKQEEFFIVLGTACIPFCTVLFKNSFEINKKNTKENIERLRVCER